MSGRAGDGRFVARATADASQSQLLAILYRFEGSDEKRLIRTKIDVNEGLSADALRQHLLSGGVDVNAYRRGVFDEHFKAYSTVRDDQFSVDALRVVEPGPSTPQAHAIEVLLEPQHTPRARAAQLLSSRERRQLLLLWHAAAAHAGRLFAAVARAGELRFTASLRWRHAAAHGVQSRRPRELHRPRAHPRAAAVYHAILYSVE